MKKRSGKGKKFLKIFLSILLLLILLLFLVLGMGFGVEDNSIIPLEESGGKMNVLLLGVDKSGLRTDSMMLASYDLNDKSLNLLSIPRDTKVYVTNKKVTRKINEVHAMKKNKAEIMGPIASVEAVTAITGIPINYYIEFNLDSIDSIMDTLGPVEFEVPDVEGKGRGMNYDDPVQDLHIHLKPGKQMLSGNQIQQFLRYRKSNNKSASGGDDSGRVQRQQDLLKAIIEQKVNLALIPKIPDIYATVKKDIKTNLSTTEIIRYSSLLQNIKSERIYTHTLPGENKLMTAWYFVCDLEDAKDLIRTEFGYDTSGITDKMEITGDVNSIRRAANLPDKKPDKVQENAEEETFKAEDKKPEPTKAPATEKQAAEPDEKTEPEDKGEPEEEPEETPETDNEPETDDNSDDETIILD